MAEVRLIDANAFVADIKTEIMNLRLDGLKGTPRPTGELYDIIDRIGEQPTVDPDSLRPKGLYSAHEVAEIIAELFGDNCACNFNGIDEWLPEKCELGDACPNAVGVACWEQYLKYREERSEHG